MFLFRISFFRQLVIALFLAAFGWEAIQNAMRVGDRNALLTTVLALIACFFWWLAWRAIRVGFRVLSAHARVTFGND